MSERKIINDPVFGFINIPKGLLYNIVCHPLLQRLTRIKQLGLSSAVYPGAQHTRFQHSLGAFYLMSEAISHLTAKGNFIFDSEAEAVQAAILLHDTSCTKVLLSENSACKYEHIFCTAQSNLSYHFRSKNMPSTFSLYPS